MTIGCSRYFSIPVLLHHDRRVTYPLRLRRSSALGVPVRYGISCSTNRSSSRSSEERILSAPAAPFLQRLSNNTFCIPILCVDRFPFTISAGGHETQLNCDGHSVIHWPLSKSSRAMSCPIVHTPHSPSSARLASQSFNSSMRSWNQDAWFPTI